MRFLRSAAPMPHLLVAVTLLATLVSLAQATVVDRDYRLGDDSLEDAANAPGGAVGQGPTNVSPGFTIDSEGPSGAFVDLSPSGNPTYVLVGATRPGAAAGARGISFDGIDDALTTLVSMNAPTQMANNFDFFPSGYPRDYGGIFAHGIQLWARPDAAGLGNQQRQDLVIDTPQNGIYISANDTWGLQFDGRSIDSNVAVDTVANNGWTHLMQLGGASDIRRGRSAFGGVLLVNGVAVAADPEAYQSATSSLSIGANQAGSGNWYDGTLDDIELFLWGTTISGQQWGALDLGTDNEWIAMEFERLATVAGVSEIPAGDVNFDGVVSGDGSGPAATDDVRAFIENWMSTNLVNGVKVGDWNSRQQGDLNFDGTVDLFDFAMLRDAHPDGPSLNLAALLASQAVPEPGSAVLTLVLGLGLGFGSQQRGRHIRIRRTL
jgi:hypothetical protein